MTTPEDKDRLEELMARLDPKTAKRAQFAAEVEITKYPIASRSITAALGGGIGAGRLFLLYGPQSSGKSLVAGQTIADFQKAGLTAGLLDLEGAYDKKFGARMGIDNERLLYYRHQAVDRVTKKGVEWIKAGLDLLVVDSISEVISDAFLDKDGELNDIDGQKQMGAQAKAIRKMLDSFQYYNESTAIFLISQTTTDLSGMYPIQIPHGGKKTLFKCSQIVKLTSSAQENKQIMGTVQLGDHLVQAPIGRHVDAYVEKNKLGPQSRRGEYDLYYDGDYIGIDRFGEEVDLAVDYGAIEQKGAWFTFDDIQWQGRKNMVEALRTDDELMRKVNDRVRLIQTGEVID